MKEYLPERGYHNGPLFCHVDGSYLSRFQFNKVLERTVTFVDDTISNVKSHSFRIGGATNAICKGIPYEKVQEMGRWKSHAAKKYIRVPIIDVAALI
jgi:site-specific recombinase XerD